MTSIIDLIMTIVVVIIKHTPILVRIAIYVAKFMTEHSKTAKKIVICIIQIVETEKIRKMMIFVATIVRRDWNSKVMQQETNIH